MKLVLVRPRIARAAGGRWLSFSIEVSTFCRKLSLTP